MSNLYYPTGNEYVALPTINQLGEVENLNVISMADRGLLEVSGAPFLRLEFLVNDEIVPMSGLSWTMKNHWVPTFTLAHGNVSVDVSYVAPLQTRGWFLRVHTSASAPVDIKLKLYGNFTQLLHSINETKPVVGKVRSYESLWNQGLMFDFVTDITKLSLGFLTESGFDKQEQGQASGSFVLEKTLRTISDEPHQTDSQNIYMGIGLDEVGAAAQAIHMQRVGGKVLFAELQQWLEKRELSIGDRRLDEILNRNQFFNFFYASGKTLDSEETILCTSRSPRYYVSAAYWDRDSLIWSFPALLVTEPGKARQALDYVFGRQIRNVGIHSRYIDGTILEPGFELDELCAPLLALDQYIRATGDRDYLGLPKTVEGIELIVNRLKGWKHPEIDLYGSFLMPTDDMHVYPYLTYNNVLVWKVLVILADFFDHLGQIAHAEWAKSQARRVRSAIKKHCVVTTSAGPQYVWSTDLEGRFDFYDEPPGSLTLLAHYGFCATDDPVFVNTMTSLYSVDFAHYFAGTKFEELGCSHAENPWVLSIANSLLNGRKTEAFDMLKRASMDNLIACESIDAETGGWATGAHFATCAGFLVYALLHASGKTKI